MAQQASKRLNLFTSRVSALTGKGISTYPISFSSICCMQDASVLVPDDDLAQGVKSAFKLSEGSVEAKVVVLG
jgi:hypothetical protein